MKQVKITDINITLLSKTLKKTISEEKKIAIKNWKPNNYLALDYNNKCRHVKIWP